MAFAITDKVVLKAWLLRCDKCPGLFERLRQVAEFFCELRRSLFFRSIIVFAPRAREEKLQRLFRQHDFYLNRLCDAQRVEDLCTRGQQRMASCVAWTKFLKQLRCVCVVEDEQPARSV